MSRILTAVNAPTTALQPPPAQYYLQNFLFALRWILSRYGDLLRTSEISFVENFGALPRQSQALLVRLIMRKGQHFRDSRIVYPEIGNIERAAAPLESLGWIDAAPLISIDALFKLTTRSEVAAIFSELPASVSKASALQLLRERYCESRRFECWRGNFAERVYLVTIAPLCTHLRLLFFGNFRQDWSEFVLADLGVFKYEPISFSSDSRAFHSRDDIENFFALYECRRQLAEAAPLQQALARLPRKILTHEWLENRRAKILFQIARAYERNGERETALALYKEGNFPGAQVRAIRILELSGRLSEACEMAARTAARSVSDGEKQRLDRVIPRLQRRLGLSSQPKRQALRPERLDLAVPPPRPDQSVEILALERIAAPGVPVFYVENSLLNSLFGLLCWQAIFAPISGAFFHPFHSAPVDLFSPTFRARREDLFRRSLERLDGKEYQSAIVSTFREKHGTQTPFVSWGLLSEQLLTIAMRCIPAAHLRCSFERLLKNIRENRSGLPDLVQFWPNEGRYRMIEVKGPGDRLQDNQRRWLDFCLKRGIPVAVCHVRWTSTA